MSPHKSSLAIRETLDKLKQREKNILKISLISDRA